MDIKEFEKECTRTSKLIRWVFIICFIFNICFVIALITGLVWLLGKLF